MYLDNQENAFLLDLLTKKHQSLSNEYELIKMDGDEDYQVEAFIIPMTLCEIIIEKINKTTPSV